MDEARQVMGSADKLQQMRKGAAFESVVNAGKVERYHLQRLGDKLHSMNNTDYGIAKTGGRHKGLYTQWHNKSRQEITKSIKSLHEQVDIHKDKINNPDKYFDRVVSRIEKESYIMRYWPKEIRNFEQQINILNGILAERIK